jgi:ribosomal protein S26
MVGNAMNFHKIIRKLKPEVIIKEDKMIIIEEISVLNYFSIIYLIWKIHECVVDNITQKIINKVKSLPLINTVQKYSEMKVKGIPLTVWIAIIISILIMVVPFP